MCGFADVNRKGNMKKLNSAKIAFVVFSTLTLACLAGSVSGSLAWYAYSTRALVSYSGTSINETSLLQIGICSDEKIDDMPNTVSEVKYQEDKINETEYSSYYYFAESGKGLTYDIIAKYLSLPSKGYATNELEPLTSGSWVAGNDQDDFALKQAPNEVVHGNTIAALKQDYLTIPLVFRIKTGEGADDYADNIELWLSKAIARASTVGDGEVYKAIRMFIDRDARNYGGWQSTDDIATGTEIPTGDLGHAYYLKTDDNKLYSYKNNVWSLLVDGIRIEASAQDIDTFDVGEMYFNSSDNKLYAKPLSDFIINPSADSKGRTRVGGVLNRNNSAYYDYNNDGEILYGEYDNAALGLISNTGYSGEDIEDDVNGVGNTTPSTFVAKHCPGYEYYSNLYSPANDALFKHAEYESISSISPERDGRDRLTNANPLNPTSVCKTRSDDHHLARVNLTVYLEGWDFAVVDQEMNHSFNLGLTFEMSSV